MKRYVITARRDGIMYYLHIPPHGDYPDAWFVPDISNGTWFVLERAANTLLVKYASYQVQRFSSKQESVPETVNKVLETLRVIEIETDEIYWQ